MCPRVLPSCVPSRHLLCQEGNVGWTCCLYLQTCCPDVQFYPQNSRRLGNQMLRNETDQACKQGFPDSSVSKESTCNAGDPSSRRDRLPTPVSLGVPCGSAGKESACHVGDLGSIPGLGRSPGEGKGYPLQYSGLENSMDCIVHGVTKSWTRLRDFHPLQLFRLFHPPTLAHAPTVRSWLWFSLRV